MNIPKLASERFRTDLIARLFELRARAAFVDRAIIAAIRFVDAADQASGERLSAAFAEVRSQSEMAEEIAKMLDETADQPAMEGTR